MKQRLPFSFIGFESLLLLARGLRDAGYSGLAFSPLPIPAFQPGIGNQACCRVSDAKLGVELLVRRFPIAAKCTAFEISVVCSGKPYAIQFHVANGDDYEEYSIDNFSRMYLQAAVAGLVAQIVESLPVMGLA